MPPQRTLTDMEYEGQPRQTWGERFMQRMDTLMPWARPDETTILNFRHPAGTARSGEAVLAEITRHLAAHGLRLQAGTIVDATIIDAPVSTKNRAQARDPELHQVKQGNPWYFGMKAHIGVDAHTGLVHRGATTAANVADVTQVP